MGQASMRTWALVCVKGSVYTVLSKGPPARPRAPHGGFEVMMAASAYVYMSSPEINKKCFFLSGNLIFLSDQR